MCPRDFVHVTGPGVPARATSGWEPRVLLQEAEPGRRGSSAPPPGASPALGRAGGGWGPEKVFETLRGLVWFRE